MAVSPNSTNSTDSPVSSTFNEFSDNRFQRRRSRKKSIDVLAIQEILSKMGYTVSMVEIFNALKDYNCPKGMFGKIEYEEFLVILRNTRAKKQNDTILVTAFEALGGNKETVKVTNVLKSIERLKEFNVDTEELEIVCAGKEETDSMDFNEFAACFE